MFSKMGPSLTRTDVYLAAWDSQTRGLPRNSLTSCRCSVCMERRRMEESRAGLLVLQVRTRKPFRYPLISSKSSAGGFSFFTLSSLMAPSSRFQSAPRTSFSSPNPSMSLSQRRRSRGFPVPRFPLKVSCFTAPPALARRSQPAGRAGLRRPVAERSISQTSCWNETAQKVHPRHKEVVILSVGGIFFGQPQDCGKIYNVIIQFFSQTENRQRYL